MSAQTSTARRDKAALQLADRIMSDRDYDDIEEEWGSPSMLLEEAWAAAKDRSDHAMCARLDRAITKLVGAWRCGGW